MRACVQVALRQQYGCDSGECRPGASFTAYAECVRGCSAHMLTGRWCGDEGPPEWSENSKALVVDAKPAEQNTSALAGKAVEVLQRSAGFIGLTDHWAATICLWHKRFGGECLASEMADTRPGSYRPDISMDSQWNGDEVDERVYDAGAAIFWAQLAAHGLTGPTACEKVCPGIDPAHFETESFSREASRQAEERFLRATSTTTRLHALGHVDR